LNDKHKEYADTITRFGSFHLRITADILPTSPPLEVNVQGWNLVTYLGKVININPRIY